MIILSHSTISQFSISHFIAARHRGRSHCPICEEEGEVWPAGSSTYRIRGTGTAATRSNTSLREALKAVEASPARVDAIKGVKRPAIPGQFPCDPLRGYTPSGCNLPDYPHCNSVFTKKLWGLYIKPSTKESKKQNIDLRPTQWRLTDRTVGDMAKEMKAMFRRPMPMAGLSTSGGCHKRSSWQCTTF